MKARNKEFWVPMQEIKLLVVYMAATSIKQINNIHQMKTFVFM